MWSVGCIFGELLGHAPMFPGKSEIDQINKIFKELGTPNDKIWPGWTELPAVKKVNFAKQPYNNLRNKYPFVTESGLDLLNKLLTYDPSRRITADEALKHQFFKESPLPVDPSMFPTWPAKSELPRSRKHASPSAPKGGRELEEAEGADGDGSHGFHMGLAKSGHAAKGAGFSLRF
jgi:cell division cycle 2-like protein